MYVRIYFLCMIHSVLGEGQPLCVEFVTVNLAKMAEEGMNIERSGETNNALNVP